MVEMFDENNPYIVISNISEVGINFGKYGGGWNLPLLLLFGENSQNFETLFCIEKSLNVSEDNFFRIEKSSILGEKTFFRIEKSLNLTKGV